MGIEIPLNLKVLVRVMQNKDVPDAIEKPELSY